MDAWAKNTAVAIPSAVDVLVMGSGPAGAAAAIVLAEAGLRVLIVSREETMNEKIGESLAPSARTALRQLGVWDTFTADQHLPCWANKSSWGSAELSYHDFINDPAGHGWHVDRLLFERRLIERALRCGASHTTTLHLRQATWANGQWWVDFNGPYPRVATRYIVDATGRHSAFARRRGARRVFEDRQIAVVSFLRTIQTPLADTTSLVEATSEGWWYSALLPDGRLAMAFFTDGDSDTRRCMASATGWEELLRRTQCTARRVDAHGYRLGRAPRIVSADSGRLDRLYGDGWLAVGDAALTYDPLSSHGLTMALVSGRDGAKAILALFSGDENAPEVYERQLSAAFVEYAAMRREFYRAERRWLTMRYWQRRMASAEKGRITTS